MSTTLKLASLLVLVGGCNSFANAPPQLLSVNGIAWSEDAYYDSSSTALAWQPGEDFEITLEVEDPNGHDILVWWPLAPEGWEFPPEGTQGVWHVPPDHTAIPQVYLVLEDVHPTDPRYAIYWPTFWPMSTGILTDTATDTGQTP